MIMVIVPFYLLFSFYSIFFIKGWGGVFWTPPSSFRDLCISSDGLKNNSKRLLINNILDTISLKIIFYLKRREWKKLKIIL